MRVWAARMLKRISALLAIAVVVLLAIRIYDSQRGQPLEPWHKYVPEELSVEEIDKDGWAEYLQAEAVLFDTVRAEVTQKLPPEDRIPVNRYFDGSPIYPGHFSQDWNRSYEIEPAARFVVRSSSSMA